MLFIVNTSICKIQKIPTWSLIIINQLIHDLTIVIQCGGAAAVQVVGATVPVTLLLLRQALDFSYKEELVMDTLTDYVEQMRSWAEEIPAAKKADPVLQEEIVDKITSSIKQTAASGSHFSKMLTPEEEKIMREIIREFMA